MLGLLVCAGAWACQALDAPRIMPRNPVMKPSTYVAEPKAFEAKIVSRQPKLVKFVSPAEVEAAAKAKVEELAQHPQIFARQPLLIRPNAEVTAKVTRWPYYGKNGQRPAAAPDGDTHSDQVVSLTAKLAEVEAALELTRSAFATSLVTAHESKLADLAVAKADKETVLFQVEMTRQAFAEALVYNDAARVQAKADQQAVEAQLATTRKAFADSLIQSHLSRIRQGNVLKLQLEDQAQLLDAQTKQLEERNTEFEELRRTLTEHVERSDDLVERQGNELRKARKTLAAVAGAIAGASAIGGVSQSDDDDAERAALKALGK
ncbi:hypothetical protein M885DRAFT_512369 [Pelagophyceae sp. CCMP2097]|nr:hypothetical protein M885DRAFT_512369 [Pelagophyceae sp. CCMP2097]